MWDSAYLPISTNTIFDRFGAPYNTSRVLTPDLRLDIAAYEQYSPAYLPITFAMLYLIYLALASSSLVHLVLYHGKDMWKTVKDIKNAQTDIHAKLMLAYKEVPWWWYGITFSVFIAMAIAVNEVSNGKLYQRTRINVVIGIRFVIASVGRASGLASSGNLYTPGWDRVCLVQPGCKSANAPLPGTHISDK